MAQLWQEDQNGEWQPHYLEANATYLLDGEIERVEGATPELCVLRRSETTCVVLAGTESPPISVNGRELSLGIRVLKDRDEMVTHSSLVRRHFYSTEVRPATERYSLPDSGSHPRCPRCMQGMEEGQVAVCCPTCGVWHHESRESPCWSYAESCGSCHRQPTDLDEVFRFHPEDL